MNTACGVNPPSARNQGITLTGSSLSPMDTGMQKTLAVDGKKIKSALLNRTRFVIVYFLTCQLGYVKTFQSHIVGHLLQLGEGH